MTCLLSGGSFLYVAPEIGRAGMDSLSQELEQRNVLCHETRPCPAEYVPLTYITPPQQLKFLKFQMLSQIFSHYKILKQYNLLFK